MSDLIDRQAAVDVIDRIFPADAMKSDYTQGIACGAALAKAYIEQLPSAQPQRKTGQWIDIDGDGTLYQCDQCRAISCCDANYCPSCGVKMEVEHE